VAAHRTVEPVTVVVVAMRFFKEFYAGSTENMRTQTFGDRKCFTGF
jgi:hypothetical protein